MDENLDKKTNNTYNLIKIYDKNKIKIYFLIALILSVTFHQFFITFIKKIKIIWSLKNI